MEPEKPKPPFSADERLANDVRQEAALLRNILHFSLWTLVALIPTMLLLLVDMPMISRVITGILCAVFSALAIGGMFRITGFLEAVRRPIFLNRFHGGKEGNKYKKRK